MPETVELNSYSLPIVNTPKLCTKETPSTKQNFKMSGDNTKSCDENITPSELEIDQSSQFAYQILADTPKENNILFSLKQKKSNSKTDSQQNEIDEKRKVVTNKHSFNLFGGLDFNKLLKSRNEEKTSENPKSVRVPNQVSPVHKALKLSNPQPPPQDTVIQDISLQTSGQPKNATGCESESPAALKRSKSQTLSNTDSQSVKNENNVATVTPKLRISFERTKKQCEVCDKVVYEMEKIVIEKHILHITCFKCSYCSKVLNIGNYSALSGKYYCKPHFKQLFQLKGNYSEAFGEEKPTKKMANFYSKQLWNCLIVLPFI